MNYNFWQKFLTIFLFISAFFVGIFAWGLPEMKSLGGNTPESLEFVDLEHVSSKTPLLLVFSTSIDEKTRQKISGWGVEVLDYIPNNSYLIRGSLSALERLKQFEHTKTLMRYEALWKICPDLVLDGDVVVTVHLFSDSALAPVLENIHGLSPISITILGRNAIELNIRAEDLVSLAENEAIEWIEEKREWQWQNFEIPSSTDIVVSGENQIMGLSGYETGTRLMGFERGWSAGLTGRGETIAFADSGLDRGSINRLHSDFLSRIPLGHFFGLMATSWEDPHGHGTHVAGSIGGDGAMSNGQIRGGAKAATLIPQSLYSPLLRNISVPQDLHDVFERAYQDGARIHNNSWASSNTRGAYDVRARDVDRFAFERPNFLIIFAAGNEGVDFTGDGRIDPGSISSPATAKNTLAVGASKNFVLKGGIQEPLEKMDPLGEIWPVEPLRSSSLSETDQGLAPFSSRGPTRDGRIKPDVVAPGTNILSARSQHPNAGLLWGEYNQHYVWSGGTSMSAPLVAGAAGLLREALRDYFRIKDPSSALLRGLLMVTAKDLYPGQFGFRDQGQEILTLRPGPDQGFGRVQVEKAVALEGIDFRDVKAGIREGEYFDLSFEVKEESRLSALLIYTDYPAALAAHRALVNDLDLTLLKDNQVIAESAGQVDNFEWISGDLEPGNYVLQVFAQKLPMPTAEGTQPFALIKHLQ